MTFTRTAEHARQRMTPTSTLCSIMDRTSKSSKTRCPNTLVPTCAEIRHLRQRMMHCCHGSTHKDSHTQFVQMELAVSETLSPKSQLNQGSSTHSPVCSLKKILRKRDIKRTDDLMCNRQLSKSINTHKGSRGLRREVPEKVAETEILAIQLHQKDHQTQSV